MRVVSWLVGLATALIAVESASAAVETRTVTVTNSTASGFSGVVFYFQPPLVSPASEFRALRFAEELSLFGASIPPSNVSIVDSPTNDLVRFDFEPVRIDAGEQVEFTLAIDNPLDAEYSFGWRLYEGAIELPTPGSAALGVAALLVALTRGRGR